MKRWLSALFLFFVFFGVHAQSRIIYFKATALGDSVRLNFTISSGTACAGYNVLKGSDSLNLNPVYVYPGICGNNSSNETYAYTDFSPNKTTPNFYRILIPPGDYSNTLRVDVAASFSDMIIFPQPTEDILNIKFLNKSYFYYEMKIYDRFGRKMGETNGNSSDRITVNVSGLPIGLYAFMIIDINGNAYRGKFIKTNSN